MTPLKKTLQTQIRYHVVAHGPRRAALRDSETPLSSPHRGRLMVLRTNGQQYRPQISDWILARCFQPIPLFNPETNRLHPVAAVA